LNVELKDIRQENGTYDLVFSDGLLEHFPKKIFTELVKALCSTSKKYIIIIQPNYQNFLRKMVSILGLQKVIEW